MTPGAPPTASWAARAFRLVCPHCGLQAVSVGRKWAMTCWSWDKPVPCRACAQMVVVRAWSAMVWTLPFMVFVFGANVLFAFSSISARWVVAFGVPLALLALLGQLFGVPLSKKGHTDPDAVRRARADAAQDTESIHLL